MVRERLHRFAVVPRDFQSLSFNPHCRVFHDNNGDDNNTSLLLSSKISCKEEDVKGVLDSRISPPNKRLTMATILNAAFNSKIGGGELSSTKAACRTGEFDAKIKGMKRFLFHHSCGLCIGTLSHSGSN